MSDIARDIERLLELLDAEERLYGELRSALQREQTCLVNLEAEGLDEAVRQKETLVTEARVLETGRRTLVERMADATGIPQRPATLTDLCAALGPIADPLRDAQSRLRGLVGAVRELLEINAGLAGEAMGQVEATLTLLGRLAPAGATYRPDGAESRSSGRLVQQSA